MILPAQASEGWSRDAAVDFSALGTSRRSQIKNMLLRKKAVNKSQQLLNRNYRMPRPAKERHPGLPELSINESGKFWPPYHGKKGREKEIQCRA